MAALFAAPREIRRPTWFAVLIDPHPSGATRARMAIARSSTRGDARDALGTRRLGSRSFTFPSTPRPSKEFALRIAPPGRSCPSHRHQAGTGTVLWCLTQYGVERGPRGTLPRDRLERRVAHRSAARKSGPRRDSRASASFPTRTDQCERVPPRHPASVARNKPRPHRRRRVAASARQPSTTPANARNASRTAAGAEHGRPEASRKRWCVSPSAASVPSARRIS